jgi:hypothetical protein
MTFQSTNNLYGFPQPLTRVFPAPIIAQRAPETTDFIYPIGQEWVDEVGQAVYFLTAVVSNSATWIPGGSSSGSLSTLTTQDDNVATPVAGTILVDGATSQLETTSSGNTVTIALVDAVITPGSLEVTGLLTGDAGTTIHSAGTPINIGTDTDTAAINIGTAGDRTTTIGSDTASAEVLIQVGSGGTVQLMSNGGNISSKSDGGILELAGGGGPIFIGADHTASSVEIGAAEAGAILIESGTSVTIGSELTLAKSGKGTLTSGVYTLAVTGVTTSSLVFPSYVVPEVTPGILSGVCTSGHITITSTDLTDSTSTIQWFTIN